MIPFPSLKGLSCRLSAPHGPQRLPAGLPTHSSFGGIFLCLVCPDRLLLASDTPATGADVLHCRTGNNSPDPNATPVLLRSHASRCPRTSHSATAAPRTRCPGSDHAHPCSPTPRLTPSDRSTPAP